MVHVWVGHRQLQVSVGCSVQREEADFVPSRTLHVGGGGMH
jgi:hypothetical protein